jgi:hypothetical protein
LPRIENVLVETQSLKDFIKDLQGLLLLEKTKQKSPKEISKLEFVLQFASSYLKHQIAQPKVSQFANVVKGNIEEFYQGEENYELGFIIDFLTGLTAKGSEAIKPFWILKELYPGMLNLFGTMPPEKLSESSSWINNLVKLALSKDSQRFALVFAAFAVQKCTLTEPKHGMIPDNHLKIIKKGT